MKRLTFEGNFCDIARCTDYMRDTLPYCPHVECNQRKTWERLKAIEDILGDEYDLDRLRELVEADRERRCVVLPCRGWLGLVFGDQEVFYALDDDYKKGKICEITVRNEERFSWYDGWKNVIFNGTDENGLDFEFRPEDIGETVFLTREAAEKALEEMEETTMAEYIEREAVEKMLENAQIICDDSDLGYCGYCVDDIDLSSIPAADVAPVVHSCWEQCDYVEPCVHGFGTNRIKNAGIKCLNCVHVFKKSSLWRRNFCPNCGAKMDLEG